MYINIQQKNLGKMFCENTSSNECNKGFNSLDILDVQKSWQERNAGSQGSSNSVIHYELHCSDFPIQLFWFESQYSLVLSFAFICIVFLFLFLFFLSEAFPKIIAITMLSRRVLPYAIIKKWMDMKINFLANTEFLFFFLNTQESCASLKPDHRLGLTGAKYKLSNSLS